MIYDSPDVVVGPSFHPERTEGEKGNLTPGLSSQYDSPGPIPWCNCGPCPDC